MESGFDALREQITRHLEKTGEELASLIEKHRQDVMELQAPAAEPTSARGLRSLRAATASLDGADSQAEILARLLEVSTSFSTRAALLLKTPEGLKVWSSTGFGASHEGEVIAAPDTFTAAIQGSGAQELSATECQDFLKHLGAVAGGAGAIIPLILRDQVPALLYADAMGDDELTVEALQLLTYTAAQCLETLPLRSERPVATLLVSTSDDAELLAADLAEDDADAAGDDADSDDAASLETEAADLETAETDSAETETVDAESDHEEAASEEASSGGASLGLAAGAAAIAGSAAAAVGFGGSDSDDEPEVEPEAELEVELEAEADALSVDEDVLDAEPEAAEPEAEPQDQTPDKSSPGWWRGSNATTAEIPTADAADLDADQDSDSEELSADSLDDSAEASDEGGDDEQEVTAEFEALDDAEAESAELDAQLDDDLDVAGEEADDADVVTEAPETALDLSEDAPEEEAPVDEPASTPAGFSFGADTQKVPTSDLPDPSDSAAAPAEDISESSAASNTGDTGDAEAAKESPSGSLFGFAEKAGAAAGAAALAATKLWGGRSDDKSGDNVANDQDEVEDTGVPASDVTEPETGDPLSTLQSGGDAARPSSTVYDEMGALTSPDSSPESSLDIPSSEPPLGEPPSADAPAEDSNLKTQVIRPSDLPGIDEPAGATGPGIFPPPPAVTPPPAEAPEPEPVAAAPEPAPPVESPEPSPPIELPKTPIDLPEVESTEVVPPPSNEVSPPNVVSPQASSAPNQVVPPDDVDEGPGWAFTGQLGAKEEAQSGNPTEGPLHDEARRLARLLVSEIKLYNEEQIEEGRKRGNIYDSLRDDIERSKRMYEERIDQNVRETTDYFRDELVRSLADGDAQVMGI